MRSYLPYNVATFDRHAQLPKDPVFLANPSLALTSLRAWLACFLGSFCFGHERLKRLSSF
jgi:hypothetical protein